MELFSMYAGGSYRSVSSFKDKAEFDNFRVTGITEIHRRYFTVVTGIHSSELQILKNHAIQCGVELFTKEEFNKLS